MGSALHFSPQIQPKEAELFLALTLWLSLPFSSKKKCQSGVALPQPTPDRQLLNCGIFILVFIPVIFILVFILIFMGGHFEHSCMFILNIVVCSF